MFNIGGGEILVVLLIAMVVLGPERLPKAARDIGRAIAEFRRITTNVQSDLRDAMGADEFRESMESLRSVVDLKSSINGELQGLSTSLTSTLTDTASYGTASPAAWQPETIDGFGVTALPESPAFDGSLTVVADIPPPDGMYRGDEPPANGGDLSVPAPRATFDDVHPTARVADDAPRLGALDLYDR